MKRRLLDDALARREDDSAASGATAQRIRRKVTPGQEQNLTSRDIFQKLSTGSISHTEAQQRCAHLVADYGGRGDIVGRAFSFNAIYFVLDPI